jgi:hypothetical protein
VSQPPPQPGWQPPPPKKPKAPLLLGILIGAVAPFFGLIFPVALGNVSSPSVASDIAGLAPFAWVFLVLATGAGLLFSDRTRRWGLGILIGLFGMLIIGAGACVAVLVVVLASYSGG